MRAAGEEIVLGVRPGRASPAARRRARCRGRPPDSRRRPARESFAVRLLEVRGPVTADQVPHEPRRSRPCRRRDRRGRSAGSRRRAAARCARTRSPGAARTRAAVTSAIECGLQGKLYYDAMPSSPTSPPLESLDAWMREVVDWHFDPATGTPFWLDFAKKAGWDPRREIKTFADLQRFGEFQDEWLRGGPVQRWIPKGLAGQADLRVRDRRHDRHPQDARRVATTSGSTTSSSARRCPTSISRRAPTG